MGHKYKLMQTKVAIKSKIVWIAVANFVLALIGGFTMKTIDPLVGAEIVNLDWSNIVQAVISVAMILARVLFTNTIIKGIA